MLPIDWDGNGKLDVRDIVIGAGLEAGTRGSDEPTVPRPGGRGGCAGTALCALLGTSLALAFAAELLS